MPKRRLHDHRLRIESLEERNLLAISVDLIANLTHTTGDGAYSPFIEYDGGLLFSENSGEDGSLWWVNQTETRQLLHMPDSSVEPFYSIGDEHAIRVTNATGENSFYRTDGTIAGTQPAPEIAIESDLQLVQGYGDSRWSWSGWDSNGSFSLWYHSAGVARKVIELPDSRAAMTPAMLWSSEDAPASVENVLLFSAADAESRKQLWRTDGTESGTFRLGPRVEGNLYVLADGFFLIDNELWFTDGTRSGTVAVDPIATGNSVDFAIHKGVAAFRAIENDERTWFQAEGANLTRIGTLPIPAEFQLSPNGSWWFNDQLLVISVSVPNILVSVSDLSEPGFELVHSFGDPDGVHDFDALTGLGDQVLFNVRCTPDKLWRLGGTEPIAELRATNPKLIGDQIYFFSDDVELGSELWRLDTKSDTVELVADIIPGPTGLPDAGEVFSIEDGIALAIDDVVHGRELWTSDLTQAGTKLVRDFNPTVESSDTTFHSSDLVGDYLLYSFSTPQQGNEPWLIHTETLEVTSLGNLSPGYVRFKDRPNNTNTYVTRSGDGALVVESVADSYSRRIWRLDGTTGEFRLLIDTPRDMSLVAVTPEQLVLQNADDEFFTVEFESGSVTATGATLPNLPNVSLWKTPSSIQWNDDFIVSSANNDALLSIDPLTYEATTLAEADWLEPIGATEHHVIYGAGKSQNEISSLWGTDGTVEGTLQLATFPESYIQKLYTDTQGYIHVDAGLRFLSTNGTIAGTRQRNMSVDQTVESNGRLFLYAVARDFSRQVWVLDDPEAEPELLVSFPRGDRGLYLDSLTVADDLVFFPVIELHGEAALWASNGTVAGTGIYAETALKDLTYTNGRLFGMLESELHGFEPHVLTLDRWNNRIANHDVNGNTEVTPIDALLVINELSNRIYSSATGALGPQDPPHFLDVNDDGAISPIDALRVINQLNKSAQSAAISARTIAFAEYGDDEEEQDPQSLALQIFG